MVRVSEVGGVRLLELEGVRRELEELGDGLH
jgi:hypothetical protein